MMRVSCCVFAVFAIASCMAAANVVADEHQCPGRRESAEPRSAAAGHPVPGPTTVHALPHEGGQAHAARHFDPSSRQDSSRVVIVHHGLAHDGSTGRDNEHLDPAIVQTMVDEAVKAFTGESTLAAAWEQIIPDASKKVAIKVNCQITGIFSKALLSPKPIIASNPKTTASSTSIMIFITNP